MSGPPACASGSARKTPVALIDRHRPREDTNKYLPANGSTRKYSDSEGIVRTHRKTRSDASGEERGRGESVLLTVELLAEVEEELRRERSPDVAGRESRFMPVTARIIGPCKGIGAAISATRGADAGRAPVGVIGLDF